MYTVKTLLQKVMDDAEGDYTAALLALDDGEYLALIGIGAEDDQTVKVRGYLAEFSPDKLENFVL